jgi:hypothetical protein
MSGTAEENKAVVQGSIAYFGTIYARGGVGRSWMIIQLMPKRSRS